MTRYIARRLGNALLVMLAVTLLTFSLLHLSPGDPAALMAGEFATTQDITRMSEKLGLDKPLPQQYAIYVLNLVQGDFGKSIVYGTPALPLIQQRLPATLELTLLATLLTLAIAIPFGVIMAVKPRGLADYVGALVTLFGVSIPSFWLGIVLILIVSVDLRLLPTSGRGTPLVDGLVGLVSGHPDRFASSLRYLVLPTVTLSAFQLAFIARLTRSSVLEELGRTFVRAARARGLPNSLVMTKHVLRNALMPIVTVLGIEIGGLVGGAVIVETVFGWPGVGQLVFQSISRRDYPLAQGAIVMISGFVVALTLLVDLAYLRLDPRVRLS
jgi:peptide/nickel transport system permease protein